MITTVTVWTQTDPTKRNPSLAESHLLEEFAATLTPTKGELTWDFSPDNSEIVGTRSWPTQEMAQTWADYINSNYQHVTCSVVNT